MRKVSLVGFALVGALVGGSAVAQDANAVAIAGLTVGLDTLWVLVAAALVFFMQAGFALLEAGLQSAKNVVNILMKNYADFIIASLAFWAVGFAFMFGDGNSILGLNGWFLLGPDNSPSVDAYSGIFGALSWTGVPLAAKFIFQLVFAGTAATIVSGAVGGARQVPGLPHLFARDDRAHLSHPGSLGLGRRLACKSGYALFRFRRLNRRSRGRRFCGVGRGFGPRATHRALRGQQS